MDPTRDYDDYPPARDPHVTSREEHERDREREEREDREQAGGSDGL